MLQAKLDAEIAARAEQERLLIEEQRKKARAIEEAQRREEQQRRQRLEEERRQKEAEEERARCGFAPGSASPGFLICCSAMFVLDWPVIGFHAGKRPSGSRLRSAGCWKKRRSALLFE
jgi:hypothetical protein